MKQSLQVRLGQQIIMTPQLQQAIRLLLLSSIELDQEIQQALESNIMLEIAEEDDNETLSTDNPDLDFNQNNDLNQEISESLSDLEVEGPLPDDIPKGQTVDSDWEDIYEGTLMPYDYTNNKIKGRDLLAKEGSTTETLQDYLRWQLDLSHFSNLERACAIAIIDAIDEDGYLRASLAEIAQSLGEKHHLSTKEIETVVHRIQHFDPIGVGARDLRECLLLQLAEYQPDTPWLKEAKYIVRNLLALLGTHDYAKLTKRMKFTDQELREVINLIQSLKPCPGAQIASTQANYVIPDVFVKKIGGKWEVELNSENSAKLRINSYYANMISQTDNRADNHKLKTHLQEARWFIKSLKSRHNTLLKVAKCIVKRQSDFLEYGEEAMKPLILHDIAQELELHESTISRVTTHKYIHTPRGIFELKYFFSSHLSTNNGGECSSTAIRAMVKKLIEAENSTKPLSDNKITIKLSERGIKVARRTVAKYREAMLIPPSNERKRLA